MAPTRSQHHLVYQALRYLLVGGTTTALQLVLFAATERPLGVQLANVIAWAISTALSTVAHRGFTFLRRDRDRFDQVVGGVTSLAALGLTSLALLVTAPTSDVARVVLVLVVNAIVGCARFVILRNWFMGHRRCGRSTPESPVAAIHSPA